MANDPATSAKKKNSNIYWYIGIGVLLILILIYFFVIKKSSASKSNSGGMFPGYTLVLKGQTAPYNNPADVTSINTFQAYMNAGHNLTAALAPQQYAELNALGTWTPPLPSPATQLALNNSSTPGSPNSTLTTIETVGLSILKAL